MKSKLTKLEFGSFWIEADISSQFLALCSPEGDSEDLNLSDVKRMQAFVNSFVDECENGEK